MTDINEIRSTIATVREAEARGGSPSYMDGRAIDALNDNSAAWLAELCDRVEAAETDVIDARLSIAQLCDVRDELRRSAESAEAKLAEVERELNQAVYEGDKAKAERAKAERERDAAIAERDARLDMSPAMLGVVLEAYENGEVDVEHLDACAVCEAVKTVREFVDRRAHAKASGGEHV